MIPPPSLIGRQPRLTVPWPDLPIRNIGTGDIFHGPSFGVLPTASRPVPYLGTMFADRQIPLAATCGNLVMVSPHTLWHAGPHGDPIWPALERIAHLQVILGLPVWPQVYYDPAWWPHWIAHLDDVRARLDAQPWLRERVKAIFVDEEASLGARGNRFDHVAGVVELKRHNLPLLLDLVCAAQTRILNAVRARFPGMLLGTIEPQWVLDRTHPYYTPVPAIDVLGIDAYVPPPITSERFAAFVDPVYRYAQTIGLPILMVGQAFADSSGLWQGPMITPEQMRWYGELAERTPNVHGLIWFLLEHPTAYDPRHGDRSWGLTDYPDRLYFAQWWAQRAGVVPAAYVPQGV